MKILQLAISLGPGGAERIAVDLCNRFSAKKEDEVVLVSIKDDAIPRNIHYLKDLSPNVRFVNLHCQSALQAKTIWRVYEVIKKEHPDIVHSHTNALVLLFPALFLTHVRYVHTVHNMAQRLVAYHGYFKSQITRCLFKKKVQPITISERCHLSYSKAYKLYNDICVPNGCEALKTTEQANNVKAEIEKLKRNSDTLVFIHVARHHPNKNHDRLFRTFQRLEAEGLNFILLVLGDNFGSWVETYKDNQHIFLLGAKKNVGDYMAQADYFVLSSDVEGLPMTLLEALSMGVVPICTPAGGIVDVIKDGVNGYLAKNFDDEEFYRKIKQAISERDVISSDKIKETYEKDFSMKMCAKRYYEVYEKVLKESRL